MKLNHKEFRIGNLVEYDGRVFEIDSVSEVLPTLNTIEFGIGVVDWNNLKPIPLTEDWLVRFGFEVYEFDHKENQYRFKERLIVIRDGCFIDYGSSVSIKYVHTLQNLIFALTGTELTLTDK